jgi:hypothetical protein
MILLATKGVTNVCYGGDSVVSEYTIDDLIGNLIPLRLECNPGKGVKQAGRAASRPIPHALLGNPFRADCSRNVVRFSP